MDYQEAIRAIREDLEFVEITAKHADHGQNGAARRLRMELKHQIKKLKALRQEVSS